MSIPIRPKDHAERVALFRTQVLGPVLSRTLHHGELLAELRVLSKRSFTPPLATISRTYSVATLQRWVRRYRKDGLKGLQPVLKHRGDALELSEEQRKLALDVRRSHPSMSATLILHTLVDEGRFEADQVSAATLRRLFVRTGLRRQSRRGAHTDGCDHDRRRWEASYVGELWHADVCHGPNLKVDGVRRPLRIHGILDDKSRYVVGLWARDNEREVVMLEQVLEVVRLHGAPKTLYLDNGSTYRGEALKTACARMGISVTHARPYDPQARGKMERFWRTLREGFLDHVGPTASLHDVQVGLTAFLNRRYHGAAHAGLVGRCPAQVWEDRELTPRSEDELRDALTFREERLVRGDGTMPVGGLDWELRANYLNNKRVVVGRSLAAPNDPPWVEHEEQRLALTLVDPVANGKLRRKPRRRKPGIDALDFDANAVLVASATGRRVRS